MTVTLERDLSLNVDPRHEAKIARGVSYMTPPSVMPPPVDGNAIVGILAGAVLSLPFWALVGYLTYRWLR